MSKYIELYGEEEYQETSQSYIKEKKEKKEEYIDLDKYPTKEMKEKKTRYKIVSD